MIKEEHFEKRLKERFGYDYDTLWMDVKNKQDDMIKLFKNSEELEWFPHLKDKFIKHPNSMLILIESINICMVSDGKVLKTCYEIY